MVLINIVREEGQRVADSHCGFKYLMAHIGEYDDFKAGRIRCIGRKDREGVVATYTQLRGMGHSDKEIREMFVRFFTRDYVSSNGAADPPPKLVEDEWQSFKNSPHTRKIKSPTRAGGKVTYADLRAEGKSEKQIEKIFNARRRKYEAMETGSYRCKMYEELQKMLANFNASDYHAGKRAPALSDDVEKHSKNRKPSRPTTFCQAVARMMTLVRLAHQESGADERNWKTQQIKEQKKVANDKRCTKYNTMKDQMGVDKFNKMKARDQAAKEKKAAKKVSEAGMTARTAKFVKWRTETPEGKRFDSCPRQMYVTPHKRVNLRCHHTKHLGYTDRPGLAEVVRRLLDNTCRYENIYIKFNPDAGVASSQLYQYAPIYSGRPALLHKTRDPHTDRAFRVCGSMVCMQPREYYIQPDQRNNAPMRGNVYYSLPAEWKDYEQWGGFGVIGNPQKTTNMATLFKIVDNNIAEVTFCVDGKRYKVSYSESPSKTVDQIFNCIVKVPSPAEAAAAAAEIEKKRRAKESREKELARLAAAAASRQAQAAQSAAREERQRRFRREQMNRMLGGNHREVFGQFFGAGTKQEDATTQAKVNLAIKLAQGDINQATFNAAMDALN